MPQPVQLLSFPFAAGLDDATDPRRTPKFLQVTNYRWATKGRLDRRYGFTKLSTNTFPTSGAALASVYTLQATPYGNLQTTDGTLVYNSSSAGWVPCVSNGTPAAGWVQTTPVTGGSGQYVTNISFTTSPSPAKAVGGTPWLPAKCGSILWWSNCGIAEEYPGGAATLISIVGGGSQMQSGTHLCTVTDGATYVLGFFISSGTGGSAVGFDIYTPSGAGQWVYQGFGSFPDGTKSGWFDAAYMTGSNQLAAIMTDGTNIMHRTYTYSGAPFGNFTRTSSVQTPVTFSGVTGSIQCVSIAAGASGTSYSIWSVYDPGELANEVTIMLNPSGAGGTIFLDKARASAGVTATIPTVSVCEVNPASNQAIYCFSSRDWGIGGSAVTSSGIDKTRTLIYPGGSCTGTSGVSLVSRPYVQGGVPYALAYDQQSQAYLLLNLAATGTNSYNTPANVVGFVNPGTGQPVPGSLQPGGAAGGFVNLGPGAFPGSFPLPLPISLGGAQWLLPVTQAASPSISSGLVLQKLLVNHGSTVNRPAPEATAMLYPAGVPTVAGIATSMAAGIMQPPTILSIAASGAGGSFAASAQYLYGVTYIMQADDGSFLEGPPYLMTSTLLVSAGNTVSLSISNYDLCNSATAYFGVYRSAAGGTALYRLGDPTSYPVNRAAAYTTITDGAPDTAITSNQQGYWEGGVFFNEAPGACSIAARVRDRIWLAGTPDGFTIYYSDPVTTNVATANFHTEQQLTVDQGGPITGLAQLDDKVIVFKKESVFVIYGTEGTNTGQNNTLSTPTLVPTGGIGCVSPQSVVLTPQGLMFQSERGIELLDRGLGLTFIGQGIKDTLSAALYGNITASCYVENQYQVRFFFGTPFQGVVQVVAVYSLLNGEWVTYSYEPVIASFGPTDAASINGIVYWPDSKHIWQETPGLYTDNLNIPGGSAQVMVSQWQSGWVQLGQLEGYRRFRRMQLLGQYNTSGAELITISVSTDYSPNADSSINYSDFQIRALPGFDGNRVQLEVVCVNQKAEAASVTVREFGNGQGIGWNEFAFEVIGKVGRYKKIPAAART